MTNQTDIQSNNNPWNRRFWLSISALVILRLLLALFLDLTPDEAYYWELSRRLDLSYFDHPPLVAWCIAVCRKLFGDTVFAVRFPSIIGVLIASKLIYLIGRDFLHSGKVGFWAAIIYNMTPAGIALGFVTTPDTPLALAWVVGMFAFLHAINSSSAKWWIITGIALGLGALAKYNMIFFVPGVAITILAFPKYRKLVFTSRYWLMVLLAAIGTIPILYWNSQHDWISFKFQFEHGLKHNNNGILRNTGDFLGGQLGTIGLILYPVLWISVIGAAIKSWREKDEVRFFLAWLALPMMTFFVYTGFRSKVEANWPQIAYISAMLLAAEWIVSKNYRSRLKWVVGPSVVLAILAVIQGLTLIFPIPAKSDISCRMHGWKQMGEIVRKADADTGNTACFVGQGAPLATLLGFYGKIPPERLAEIHKGGNFRFWWRNKKLATGASIVYVDTDKYSEAQAYAHRFTDVSSSTYIISKFGKQIKKINVTIMKNCKGSFEFK